MNGFVEVWGIGRANVRKRSGTIEARAVKGIERAARVALTVGLILGSLSLARGEGEWLKFDWVSLNTSDYRAFKQEWGFNASQYFQFENAEGGVGPSPTLKYGVEIHVNRHHTDNYYRDMLRHNLSRPNFSWVGLNIETGWGARADAIFALVRSVAPGLEIWRGNLKWDTFDRRNEFRKGDVIVTWYNPDRGQTPQYRPNHMGEDMNYILAQHLFFKKKFILMVQPVWGAHHQLTDPAEFERAIEIASYAPRGIGMWSANRMYRKSRTDAWVRIMIAWRDAERKPLPADLIFIPVDGRFDLNRALGRIVYHAGFAAAGFDRRRGAPGGREKQTVTWDDIAPMMPREYRGLLNEFNDRHKAELWMRDEVRRLEQVMGKNLRGNLKALGFEPNQPFQP